MYTPNNYIKARNLIPFGVEIRSARFPGHTFVDTCCYCIVCRVATRRTITTEQNERSEPIGILTSSTRGSTTNHHTNTHTHTMAFNRYMLNVKLIYYFRRSNNSPTEYIHAQKKCRKKNNSLQLPTLWHSHEFAFIYLCSGRTTYVCAVCVCMQARGK